MTARALTTALAACIVVTASSCHVLAGLDTLTLRENAELVWRQAWSGSGNARVRALGSGTSEDVLVAGTFGESLELGGKTLLGDSDGAAFAVVLRGDGTVKHAGTISSPKPVLPLAARGLRVAGLFEESLAFGGAELEAPTKSPSLFVVEVDGKTGAAASARAFGGTDFALEGGKLALAVDSTGHTLLGGGYTGTVNFPGCPTYEPKVKSNLFVAKVDASGSCVFALRNSDEAPQRVESVATDALNDFVVVGGEFVGKLRFGSEVALQNSGGVDLFLARFDEKGAVQWSHGFGNGLIQGGARVAAAPGGYSALVAFFDGTIDFGAGALTASHGHDIVVANFRPDGTLEWHKQLAVTRASCTSMPCEFDDLAAEFDAAGNLLIAGPFRGSIDIEGVTLTTDDDAPAMFLVKFDRAGHLLWSGHFGDVSDVCSERGHCELSLATGSAGDPILGGSFKASLDFHTVVNGDVGTGESALLNEADRAAFVAKFRR